MNTPSSPLPLLNESAVAKQLRIETKTLQAWRCRGGGPENLSG